MVNHRSSCKEMTLALIMLLIICSGDIETNPGSKKEQFINEFIMNLEFINGIAVHNFSKVSLQEAMATTREYDIICLSEMFLDSSFNLLDD